MVNAPLFTTLNQMRAVSGIRFRVTASETWYETAVAYMADGSTREIAAVNLTSDPMSTRSLADVQVNPDTLSLPQVDSYGLVNNLRIQVSIDPTLMSQVMQIKQADPSQTTAFDNLVQSMMFEWAGVQGQQQPLNASFDVQKYGFLHSFFGSSWSFSNSGDYPSLSVHTGLLEASWNQVFAAVKDRLLVQTDTGGVGQSFFYDQANDIFSPQADFEQAISLGAQSAAQQNGLGGWIELVDLVSESVREVDIYSQQDPSMILPALQQNLPTIFADSTLQAIANGTLNIYEGYDPNTALISSANDPSNANLFVVDQANDTVTLPYQGSNEILLVNGAENLTVEKAQVLASNAIIQLDPSISNATLSFQGDGRGDFELYSQGTKLLTIDDLLTAAQQAVSEMRLGDGTVLTVQDLIAREENAITNLSGTLYGTPGADTLDGQGLATKLVGNGGGDTFVYKTGYGALEIQEQDTTTQTSDVLSVGPGIAASDLSVTSDAAGDLILNIDGGSNGSIQLDGMLATASGGIGAVDLADGTVLTRQQLLTMAQTGSAANTQITSDLPNQTIDPAGYAHSLHLAGGNSIVKFDLGDGTVEISQIDPNSSDQNTLLFGNGIAPADVTVSTDGQGNILLTVGADGDVVKLDGMVLGPNSGVQVVRFADGTTWDAASIVSQVSTTITGYFSSYAFTVGMGNVVIPATGISAIEFGPGILSSDVMVQTDQAGDLIFRLASNSSDSLTVLGAIHQVAWDGFKAESTVQQMSFADGVTVALGANLSFSYSGGPGVTELHGSNMGANTFYVTPGTTALYCGNTGGGGPGINYIHFGRGSGHTDVNMNGGIGVVWMQDGITAKDIMLESNAAGNLVIKIADTGDTLTVKGGLYLSNVGPTSPIQAIQFSDNTVMAIAGVSYVPTPLKFTWVGVGDGQITVGSPWGQNDFIVGPNNAQIVAGDGSNTTSPIPSTTISSSTIRVTAMLSST